MNAPRPTSWLNRTTAAASTASLFSDVSHELATAVLPALLLSLGSGAAALGAIEGTADALSAAAKLWGGVMTDRVRRRKPLASAGYLVTAVGIAAIGLCTRAWQVGACRVAAWLGRGSRSAPRDFLVAAAVPPEATGRAFGLERAGDALGAVLGPLLALALLGAGLEPRRIVLFALLPGLVAFVAILLMAERPGTAAAPRAGFLSALGAVDRPFRSYLAGIFVFGCGDFSKTLLILYATEHAAGTLLGLRRETLAVALYVLYNATSAAAAFPIGALADRLGRRRVIVAGYVFAAITTAAFAASGGAPAALAVLFAATGLYVACEEVAEKAFAVDLLRPEVRGTGLGLLAATNGVADLVSSAGVGALWAAFPDRPGAGFAAAGALQLAGAAIIAAGGGRSRSSHL